MGCLNWRGRSKCFKGSLITAIVVAVLVVIIVPLAVILPRRNQNEGQKSTVLMPLYIYPTDGAFDPLYTAITAHPTLNFTIVLNPDSGPGDSTYPGDDFASAFEKLNSYSNVQTVGYVPTNYTERNISAVLSDISKYAAWSTNSSTNDTLFVKGIFFDEAVSVYSAAAAEYMSTINAAVKNSSGILGSRFVIHNPGVIPDSGLTDSNTDLTVIFEGSYSDFKTRQSSLSAQSPNRTRNGFVAHSVPNGTTLGSLLDTASQFAEYLFVTNLDDQYYESFGSDFQDFVSAVPV